jgi:energy-coupling factor transporter ATP-binding protein EcfA2
MSRQATSTRAQQTRFFHLFESLVADGKTIVMVTHDEDMARQVSRAVTIADGQIVADKRRDLLIAQMPGVQHAGAHHSSPAAEHVAPRRGESKLGLFPKEGMLSPVPVA